MSTYLIVQPDARWEAEVLEPYPGVRQLLVGGQGTAISVQVPSQTGGAADTARFARSLASAALDFAEWCEEQSRNTHSSCQESPRHPADSDV